MLLLWPCSAFGAGRYVSTIWSNTFWSLDIVDKEVSMTSLGTADIFINSTDNLDLDNYMLDVLLSTNTAIAAYMG